MEDDFPPGGQTQASPGHPTTFVSVSDGGRFSVARALKRTDPGLVARRLGPGNDAAGCSVQRKIFAHVFLTADNLPQSIMLQFFKNGWLHRAVWGDYDVIPWGTPNTTEKVSMGPLPEAGKWVRLEIPVEKIGLHPGDLLTGFATTQFGGTVSGTRSVSSARAIRPTILNTRLPPGGNRRKTKTHLVCPPN